MIRKTWFSCLVNGSITIYMLHFNRWASTDISFVVAQELTSSTCVRYVLFYASAHLNTLCIFQIGCNVPHMTNNSCADFKMLVL